MVKGKHCYFLYFTGSTRMYWMKNSEENYAAAVKSLLLARGFGITGNTATDGNGGGNAKREPLSRLLSGGPYLDEVCTTLGTLREKNTKCAGCAYFELCNGGCRAVALALTGDKLGVDPSKCLFWEQGYHKKIEALLPQYHTVSTEL